MGIEARQPAPKEAEGRVNQALAETEITIASLLERRQPERIKRRTLDFVATHIPGIYLTVATGEEAPDMLRSEQEQNDSDVRLYYLTNQFIKRLNVLSKPIRDRMVERAIKNKGLRGGFDEQIGGEVQLNPTFEIDIPLLVESLGEEVKDYVHQKTIFSFELDPEKDDVDGIEKAVKGVLKRRSKDPEIVKREDMIRIDRDELIKAAKKGDISLIPGTITVTQDPDKWNAVPKSVLTVPVVEEAVNRAARTLGFNIPQLENSEE